MKASIRQMLDREKPKSRRGGFHRSLIAQTPKTPHYLGSMADTQTSEERKTREMAAKAAVSDDLIIRDYSAITGYDPRQTDADGYNPTDNGANELDVIQWFERNGFGGETLLAHADVSISNRDHIKKAIHLFNGVYVGVALPITAQNQDIWDVVMNSNDNQPGSWGLHCMEVLGFDARIVKAITWGGVQAMTWEFVHTYFDEIHALWVSYLKEGKLWGNDDPLFPATMIMVGPNRHFEVSGLERRPWRNASAIRKIFRQSFVGAGLPYFNPHSFRTTLTRLGQELCKTPEHFKAWSQNLGHESPLTTFVSYGEVAGQRQAEIIRGLSTPNGNLRPDVNEFADAVARKLIDSGVVPVLRVQE